MSVKRRIRGYLNQFPSKGSRRVKRAENLWRKYVSGYVRYSSVASGKADPLVNINPGGPDTTFLLGFGELLLKVLSPCDEMATHQSVLE